MSKPLSRPAFRYHGGKWRIAPWIISFFPDHEKYIEPFGGAASVLLRKEPSHIEIYNDVSNRLVRFFETIRNQSMRNELIESMRFTPYSREVFDLSQNTKNSKTSSAVEDARNILILSAMGFSSDAISRKGKTGFRTHPDAVSAFNNDFDHLHNIAKRLKSVVIENKPALEIIKNYESIDSLIYVDPPYVLSTRNNKLGGYSHELTTKDHEALLDVLIKSPAKVIVSGYKTDIYCDKLADWKIVNFNALAQSNKGSIHKTEYLWINQKAQESEKGKQTDMFELSEEVQS